MESGARPKDPHRSHELFPLTRPSATLSLEGEGWGEGARFTEREYVTGDPYGSLEPGKVARDRPGSATDTSRKTCSRRGEDAVALPGHTGSPSGGSKKRSYANFFDRRQPDGVLGVLPPT